MLTLFVGIAELGMGSIFLISFVPKLMAPDQFAATVRSYQIVPDASSLIVAGLVILFEMLIAVALLTSTFAFAALVSAATLLGVFLVAGALVIQSKRNVPCGCFGESSKSIGPRTQYRNLMLLLTTIAAIAAKVQQSAGHYGLGGDGFEPTFKGASRMLYAAIIIALLLIGVLFVRARRLFAI